MKPTKNFAKTLKKIEPRKSGIYLTEKGKAVYGNGKIETIARFIGEDETMAVYAVFKEGIGYTFIANSLLELKALVDLGLVEIV